MKAKLVHVEGMRFRAAADTDPEVLFDAGDPGSRRGPSPMQGVLLSAMACTASDVVSILQKERVRFSSLEVEAEAERAKDPPRVFTKVRMHYRVGGKDLRDSAVKRAIDLSSEKYCSVEVMLRRGGVEFVNTYEVVPET